jgi:hypothetical protein
MRALKALKILAIVVVAITVFGFLTKELWNWLMTSIFHLRPITMVEAIGLLLLGKILFGGFHKHGHHGSWNERREWKRRMKARWSEMSDEDRAKFRAGMKGCCDWGGRRDWGSREDWGGHREAPKTTEGAQ